MQTYRYVGNQMKRLQMRTYHWPQCPKTLPTARTTRTSHRRVMSVATKITWDPATVNGRKVSNHCPSRARRTHRTKQSWACANETPVPPHPSQDPEPETTADNSPEAARAESQTDTTQTWPPHKTENMVGVGNIRRRIHAPCIMQAATVAALTAN